MIWNKDDLLFLVKHRDFCAEYMLKGLDLRQSGLILGEIIKNVNERSDNSGSKASKIVVRWC